MGLERVLAVLVAVLVSVAAIQAAVITKRRAPLTQYYNNEIEDKSLGAGEYTNRLILRLIDSAIEDARDRGIGDEELTSLMHKRSAIRKCFFHAVNCW